MKSWKVYFIAGLGFGLMIGYIVGMIIGVNL